MGQLVRATLPLLSLLVVVALALVAPVDCACPRVLHRGEQFHPVFDHPHPELADEAAAMALEAGGAQLHGSHVPYTTSTLLAGGKALPRTAVALERPAPSGHVTEAAPPRPAATAAAPLDPPPELV